jgi:peroxiredoxin
VIDDIRDKGANLVAVSPQTPSHNHELIDTHRLQFEILHDAGNRYAGKLDLVHGFPEELRQVYLQLGANLAEVNGEDSWALPVPARIIAGADQRILAIESNADYTRRAEPAELPDKLPG